MEAVAVVACRRSKEIVITEMQKEGLKGVGDVEQTMESVSSFTKSSHQKSLRKLRLDGRSHSGERAAKHPV